MSETTPDIRQGTVVLHFHGVWPWPPQIAILLAESTLPNGMLRVTAEPSGQIRLSIIDIHNGTETIVQEQMTCPLVVSEPSDIKSAATWLPEGITIAINGEYAGSGAHPEFNPPILHIQRSDSPPDPTDFSRDSILAMRRRHDRQMGWQPPPHRVRGDRDYAFGTLRTEMLQVRDLLDLIERGRSHHAHGLSSRLRSLIITGRPLPLVQLCAAMNNRPLIIYTEPRPHDNIETNPHYSINAMSIAPQPIQWNTNPIDIDVWLNLPAGQIGNTVITHRSLLKNIADTIGSHLDLDILPSVVMLRSAATHVGGIRRDILVLYLARVAATVLNLSEALIADTTGEAGLVGEQRGQ